MPGLRVIRGTLRGRVLRSVPGDTTRPITDRVKEALFNILSVDVAGSRWLDLFGGTGAVGIEALSCGAEHVRFVEINRTPLEVLRGNLKQLGLTEQTRVTHQDAFQVIAHAPDAAYDYIYIAPPQYRELWQRAVELIDAQPDWLAEDGWVIVQIHPKEYTELSLNNLEVFDQRSYGDTLLVFYRRREVDADG